MLLGVVVSLKAITTLAPLAPLSDDTGKAATDKWQKRNFVPCFFYLLFSIKVATMAVVMAAAVQLKWNET